MAEALAEGGRRYDGDLDAFAGMGVQFILFAGIDFGIGVLMARRLGLWRRLRVAPIGRTLLLGSRMLSGALIALLLVLATSAPASRCSACASRAASPASSPSAWRSRWSRRASAC